MGSVIKFFKWLWSGLVDFFVWFAGVPALVVSAVSGLWVSITGVVSTLSSGDSLVAQAFSFFDSSVSSMASNVSISSPMSLGMYALSLDILFTFLVDSFAVFVVCLVAVMTFFLVAIPSFVLGMYALKITAWTIGVLFPRGFAIQGITAIANINIYKPVREALKDGKYNPFLSS